MRTLLIDGDIIAYKFASAFQNTIDWGDGVSVTFTCPDIAQKSINNFFQALQSLLEADRIVIALSDGTRNYFRKAILPTYKGNRSQASKPLMLNEIREYLEETHETFERPGLEGDDVLGILATSKKIIPGEKVIVSIDKDLLTIPGLHYNTNKPERGIVDISVDEADYLHLFQTLVGDASDGYKGCPGIGPKKAEQILAYCDGDKSLLWPLVVETFVKTGLTEQDALVQARVARILRAEDYDFKNKRPILWSPRTGVSL
jgi:DNA polymerase-1